MCVLTCSYYRSVSIPFLCTVLYEFLVEPVLCLAGFFPLVWSALNSNISSYVCLLIGINESSVALWVHFVQTPLHPGPSVTLFWCCHLSLLLGPAVGTTASPAQELSNCEEKKKQNWKGLLSVWVFVAAVFVFIAVVSMTVSWTEGLFQTDYSALDAQPDRGSPRNSPHPEEFLQRLLGLQTSECVFSSCARYFSASVRQQQQQQQCVHAVCMCESVLGEEGGAVGGVQCHSSLRVTFAMSWTLSDRSLHRNEERF